MKKLASVLSVGTGSFLVSVAAAMMRRSQTRSRGR